MSRYQPRVQHHTVLVDTGTCLRVRRLLEGASAHRVQILLGVSNATLAALRDHGAVGPVRLKEIVARLDEIEAAEGEAAE